MLNACLSVLSGTFPLCPYLHLVFNYSIKKVHRVLKKKRVRTERAKVICTNSLPHKAHEGQRVYSAPVCTQGTERDQDRRHDIFFDVHVRGKREAGRLREYRSKRVDTHWLSAIPFRVNMTHRYRPLRSIKVYEMSDETGAEGETTDRYPPHPPARDQGN